MPDDLQFSRLRDEVAHYAISDQAKAAILKREPAHDLQVVNQRLDETAEMLHLLELRLHLPFISSVSISLILEKVAKGFILSPTELTDFADFNRVCQLLASFFEKQRRYAPLLAHDAEALCDSGRHVETQIYDTISRGQVKSTADRELAKNRRLAQQMADEIKQALNHFLRSRTNQKMIQTALIVEKSGHQTIPIKASYKHLVNGTIIAASNAKTTVYVELNQVTRRNQERQTYLAICQAIEQQLLAELTAKVFAVLKPVKQNLEVMTEFDVILARAKYAQAIAGKRPHVNRLNLLKLVNLKHPLLEKPVPLSLQLGESASGLMITGPNAGGKTVALKTVGLAILMTEMGLFLPSQSPCEIPLMSGVYTCIGDHQDIDNSLSTFSAEMTTISHIVTNAQPHSLILLDELGSGTDPNEGAALAIAVLQELYQRGCLIVATTHYGNIEDFALKQTGFLTASMAFDLAHLKPTYQLVMNQVGESRALWIAQQMGMPTAVLKRAQRILKTGQYPQVKTKVVFKSKNKPSKSAENLHKGDVVYVATCHQEGLFYETVPMKDDVKVFVDSQFMTVPRRRVKLRRLASELYPKGYNLDLLFVSNWQTYKFNKDLDRGSKKAFKKLRQNESKKGAHELDSRSSS